jgi:hypothetical protein
MKVLLALLFAAALGVAAGPGLFYSRSFPGSTPAYFQIVLDRGGNAEYREALDDDNPLNFRLGESEAGEVFGFAEKLEYFKRPIESSAKVAFTGTKIFRYENGAQKGEVKFTYTEDPSARALTDWFERMGETARDHIELERTAKYDKLGVVNALLQIETAMDRKRLVALDQYLPLLDRIVANESYMNVARERAARIAAAIRNPKP